MDEGTDRGGIQQALSRTRRQRPAGLPPARWFAFILLIVCLLTWLWHIPLLQGTLRSSTTPAPARWAAGKSGKRPSTLRPVSMPRTALLSQSDAFSVALSADGRYLAAVSLRQIDDPRGSLAVWDVNELKLLRRISFTQAPVSVSFSPDGRRVAVGFSGGRVTLFDTLSFRVVGKFHVPTEDMGFGDSGVGFLRFSADGQLLAIGEVIPEECSHGYGPLRIWSLKSHRVIAVLDEGVTDAVFLPNTPRAGREPGVSHWPLKHAGFLFAGSQLEFWDAKTRRIDYLAETGTKDQSDTEAWLLAVPGSGEWAISASYSGEIDRWNLTTTPPSRLLLANHTTGKIACSSDGKLLAYSRDRMSIQLADPSSGLVKAELTGANAHVYSDNALAVSRDGSIVACANNDGDISVWRIKWPLRRETSRYPVGGSDSQ